MAITILMISVAAPLKLAGDGVKSSLIAEQEIIAFYLTQDAMEYIRNVKTGNRLAVSNDMINYIEDDCKVTPPNDMDGCRIDTTRTYSSSTAPFNSSEKIKFYPSVGVYDYRSGGNRIDSIFTRQIQIFEKRTINNVVVEIQVVVTTR